MHNASKKVEIISNVILEYLLVKNGIKGVKIVAAKEYKLITHPKIFSLISPFFPNDGKVAQPKNTPFHSKY